MPDFMGGLARPIERSWGLVERAVRNVASDMVLSSKMGVLDSSGMDGGYGGMGNMADFLASIQSAVLEAVAGFAGVGGDIVIPMYVGGTLLDEMIVDVEADSGGETEASTTQRDVVRLGVVRISVSFSVSAKWLGLLTGFK